jgi:hypothetical protein
MPGTGEPCHLKKHYGDFNQERYLMNRPHTKPQGGVKQAFEDEDRPFLDEKKATEAHGF